MQNGVKYINHKVKYINHCHIMDRKMTTQENKLRTLAFRHNRILRGFLMPIGVWPSEALQEKKSLFSRIHLIFMFTMHTAMLAAQVNYLQHNFGRISFFTLGQVYITLFMTCLVRDVILCSKAHGKLVYFFYTTFDLDHFKHKGPNYEKMSATVYKVSYYYAHIVTVMMLNGMALYNALPMYHNFQFGVFTNNLVENATLEFSVYYRFPGFKQEDHFWISTATNFYLTYLISIPMCIFDLFLYFLVFHIIGHMNVLMNNIKDIGMVRSQHRQNSGKITDVPVQLYDNEENEIINTKIAECINYHKFIIKFTDDVLTLYGPVLAGSYLFHLISCCLLLLECSQLDPGALMQYGPLTIIIFVQLIQISVIFEMIRTESDKFSDVVYSVPWESMDVRNQRSLCIFLHRVQTPVDVVAVGLAEVGIRTMAGILKTTFTYFTFLKSIA